MKNERYVVLIIFSLLLYQGCGKTEKESRSMEQIYAEKGLPVRAECIKTRHLGPAFSAYAVLTGIRQSTASAFIADKVEKIHFSVGDRVNKDDVIITFPSDNPAAQYFQAKVSFEHMKTTLARMKNLYESGGISRQEYDNTAVQYKVASANWDAVRQAVNVRSPITGMITRINVSETDNVHPGDELVTVAQTSRLKAQLWVPEDRIADIHTGAAAEAWWNGRVLKGSVSQVDLSLNGKKQAFGVQAVFDNKQGVCMSGANAEIAIFSGDGQPVPATAFKNLVRDNDTFYVYRIQGDRAVKQEVRTGRRIDLHIEILGGLEPGDYIVTQGLFMIENGQKIIVIK